MNDHGVTCPVVFARNSIESAVRLIQADGAFVPYVETLTSPDFDSPLGFKFCSTEDHDVASEYRVVLETLKRMADRREIFAASIVTRLAKPVSEQWLSCIRADIEIRNGYAARFCFDYRFIGKQLDLAEPVIAAQHGRIFD